MPVQSALTVYVLELWCLRPTCPLKLNESTLFPWPLPSKTSYPATANGPWSFPSIVDPSKANRYMPSSVASEHFAPSSSSLAFSSLANPVPTASAPTTPTSPNTTNRVAKYLFMGSVPPCFVGPHVTAAAYSCGRDERITQLQYLLQFSSRTSQNAQNANFAFTEFSEVRVASVQRPKPPIKIDWAPRPPGRGQYPG